MKTQKAGLPIAVLLVSSLIAKACTWIVLSVIALAVGGTICYGVYKMAKLLDRPNQKPAPGQPDNVLVVTVQTNAPSYGDEKKIYDNSNAGSYQYSLPNSSQSDTQSSLSFSIYYGMKSTNLWVSTVNSFDANSYVFSPSVGDTMNYSFVMSFYGNVIQFNVTGGPMGTYTSQLLSSDDTAYQVEIQRKSVITPSEWIPVATNWIVNYSYKIWNDTNAPIEGALYRLKLLTRQP